MLLALLSFVAVLQTPPPAPPQPAPPPAPPPPPATAPADPPSGEPEPAVRDEAVEEEAPPVRTRQVCRYVDVPGQRFPSRTCRTVPVDD